MNQSSSLGRLDFVNRHQLNHHISSRETATSFVIDAVESTGAATREDFDIDRIVTTAHALVDDWDFDAMTPEAFWRIASSCIKQ
ncbi:MAG: hypothetical protein J2P18_12155 [Nocardia sp.]|nr:hypothetical protein [Nocardia sp.]